MRNVCWPVATAPTHSGYGTPLGLRDHATIVIIARLAVRSAEATRLQLDEIDRREGQTFDVSADAPGRGEAHLVPTRDPQASPRKISGQVRRWRPHRKVPLTA